MLLPSALQVLLDSQLTFAIGFELLLLLLPPYLVYSVPVALKNLVCVVGLAEGNRRAREAGLKFTHFSCCFLILGDFPNAKEVSIHLCKEHWEESRLAPESAAARQLSDAKPRDSSPYLGVRLLIFLCGCLVENALEN